jgi:hypothetical protein
MNFRGTGPIRRKMRTRGFIKSFLDIWETFYLSLDGSALHLYDNRTDPEPILSLELNQIKALQIELFSHHSATFESNGKKKFSSIEDRYMMVLRTHGWDVVRIQYVLVLLPLSFFSSLLLLFASYNSNSFPEARVRETWVRTIMQAIHRNIAPLP